MELLSRSVFASNDRFLEDMIDDICSTACASLDQPCQRSHQIGRVVVDHNRVIVERSFWLTDVEISSHLRGMRARQRTGLVRNDLMDGGARRTDNPVQVGFVFNLDRLKG